MTRLTSDDIRDIPERLIAYDQALVRVTGKDLSGIACRACGVNPSMFGRAASGIRVGIIPITWGKGVIQGFSEALKAIVRHLGFSGFITRSPNLAGLCEATERQADVVMFSDDDHFVAVHLNTGKSVDNAVATGKVFAVGLDLMSGGLVGQPVLVVGCGPVGRHAGLEVLHLGAEVTVVDTDKRKAIRFVSEAEMAMKRNVKVAHNLHEALLKHRYIIDATPAADILEEQHVSGGTMISAPGVPIGLTRRALMKIPGKLLHDPLQLGVAGMLVAVIEVARGNETIGGRR